MENLSVFYNLSHMGQYTQSNNLVHQIQNLSLVFIWSPVIVSTEGNIWLFHVLQAV